MKLATVATWEFERRNKLALLAVLTLIFLPHISILPLWCTLMWASITSLCAWRMWRRATELPRLVLLPLTIAVAAGIWIQFGTWIGKEAGVALLLLMTALKLLELRAARDIFVIIFLGLFSQITAFLNDQSPLVALGAIISTWGLFAVLISVQLDAAPLSGRRRAALALRLCAWAIPLTAALFILFPRASGPLWGMPGGNGTAATGLSDSMSPGSVSKLVQSEALALRVHFDETPPPSERLYWRGPVLSRFDGRSWTPLPADLQLPPLARSTVTSRAVDYEITQEPQSQAWLFMLEIPAFLPQFNDGLSPSLSAEMTLRGDRPLLEPVRYRLRSFLDYRLQPDLRPDQLEPWLTLPRGYNPRTLALAQQLSSPLINASPTNGDTALADTLEWRLAMTVLNYWRTESFSYTLTPPALTRDSVDAFIFDTRSGFCEHYASAFTVLMRAMGVPARVVTGYLGGELNPLANLVTVRQSEAHAWSEIYVHGWGWVRIDPTSAVSPDRIQSGLDDRLYEGRERDGWLSRIGLSSLRWYWQIGQAQWQRWVIDWSQARQLDTLAKLGWPRPDIGTLSGLLAAAVLIMLAFTAWPLLRNPDTRPKAQVLYSRACRRLVRLGLIRNPHEGPIAFGQRVAHSLEPESAQAFSEITDHFVAISYRQCNHPLPLLIRLARCVSRFRPASA